MKESALLIVSTEVLPGKEEEFNRWYNDHHIPNSLARCRTSRQLGAIFQREVPRVLSRFTSTALSTI